MGLATGIQDKFSWKGVALAALGGAIGGAISPGGAFGAKGLFGVSASASATDKIVSAALRGASGSAITQGVGVATGLQSKFDWAGVAAAGIGAGVGQALGGSISKLNLDKFGTNLANNMAGGIANAATRSLVNGSDFGDNLMAALPDRRARLQDPQTAAWHRPPSASYGPGRDGAGTRAGR